ncbi:hypothetical protein TWF694_010970 [Orbilia ellipsospora]|uniref:Uncharacterized protein n=1 Tax=Orbilia ellipsospora TaxID=2528407 RepID=A0AAV9X7N4_9PEZI
MAKRTTDRRTETFSRRIGISEYSRRKIAHDTYLPQIFMHEEETIRNNAGNENGGKQRADVIGETSHGIADLLCGGCVRLVKVQSSIEDFEVESYWLDQL